MQFALPLCWRCWRRALQSNSTRRQIVFCSYQHNQPQLASSAPASVAKAALWPLPQTVSPYFRQAASQSPSRRGASSSWQGHRRRPHTETEMVGGKISRLGRCLQTRYAHLAPIRLCARSLAEPLRSVRNHRWPRAAPAEEAHCLGPHFAPESHCRLRAHQRFGRRAARLMRNGE